MFSTHVEALPSAVCAKSIVDMANASENSRGWEIGLHWRTYERNEDISAYEIDDSCFAFSLQKIKVEMKIRMNHVIVFCTPASTSMSNVHDHKFHGITTYSKLDALFQAFFNQWMLENSTIQFHCSHANTTDRWPALQHRMRREECYAAHLFDSCGLYWISGEL